MALGNNRPRNWGKDAQQAALAILLKQRNAAYKVVTHTNGAIDLMVAATDGTITLPFSTLATLHHEGRANWEARNPITGDVIASNCISQREAIRKAIEQRWV